jgi:hypothetical protein
MLCVFFHANSIKKGPPVLRCYWDLEGPVCDFDFHLDLSVMVGLTYTRRKPTSG